MSMLGNHALIVDNARRAIAEAERCGDVATMGREIGPIFRLPGYGSVDEVFATAAAVDARVVETDLMFLQSAGALFVDALHAVGLEGLGVTATDPDEWFFLESLGLDGIYTDDVPFGVQHEAPLP